MPSPSPSSRAPLMPMHRALLIYNPAAGSRWSRPKAEAVRDALLGEGVEVESVWACRGDG